MALTKFGLVCWSAIADAFFIVVLAVVWPSMTIAQLDVPNDLAAIRPPGGIGDEGVVSFRFNVRSFAPEVYVRFGGRKPPPPAISSKYSVSSM